MLGRKLLRLAAIAALLITLSITLAVNSSGAHADVEEDQAPPIPEKRELTYPNLGSHLDQLVAQVEEGETTAKGAAGEAPMHQGESVAVTIYLSGNVDDVVKFLEDNGGDPRNVGEDYIEAYVPVSLLGPVSGQPGVIRVREIMPPQPGQSAQPIAGHGPAAHLSAPWNQAGYTGQGVKVGVIDAHPAFNGFRDLLGTELPSTVQARCYTDLGRSTSDLADCEDAEDGGNHGTLVAEAVMDMAPEASLYIANPQSNGDTRKAVDWMVSEGVKVIVRSETSIFDGPGDGNSPFSDSPLKTVDRAVAGGVVWVNNAGNNAQKTWFARAPFLDRDVDGFIEFAGFDEVNDMTLEAGDEIVVQLRWDGNWGGATRNLDLGIQNNAGQLVAFSVDPQSGAAGHIPREVIAGEVLTSGGYGVIVEHVSGTAPDWIQLMVWRVPSIEHYTKSGSIGNPAESANQGLLAVGAAHWDDVRAIEPYSSRGPTPDGRVQVKPDVVGAACGATALRPLNDYNEGFCGTSQAAPHVAGMAALVRQRFPGYTPQQVATYLKDNAEQRQSPDPNNTWGHGFAKLPPPDGTQPSVPAPSNAFTRNPAADFNTLAAAFNTAPAGIWSDGTTMWVADWFLGKKIYAYDLATKARVPGRDFNTLDADTNRPSGIWSDGTAMWVSDWLNDKIYAYDLATKVRVPDRDFNTLVAAGNWSPRGIWSDGTTMWVADSFDNKIYAYDQATKARVPGKDFDSLNARNRDPEGIWSDGETMWVVDDNREKIYAYDLATKARIPDKEFNTLEAAGNSSPAGIWSDGETMWVVDFSEDKIYAYHMPQVVESAADREALIALYNATGGANWTSKTNWLTNAPIGQWHGVTRDSNGRVTGLGLNDNQLSGTIPTQLGNLTSLQELDLTRNQLTGTIPAELAGLTSLEILALGGNKLTGTIPIWLGSLTNLEKLYLWGNELTGTIPTELGSLANLVRLELTENQLIGDIPTQLGNLSNLEELYLNDNNLSGAIPTQLGGLAHLVHMRLNDNQLNGAIPTQLSSLSNLRQLDLTRNQLTGTIPEELGSLTSLEILALGGNQLTGTIPTQLGSLANLRWLSIGSNQLSGVVPQALAGLTMLEYFSFYNNLGLCAPVDEAFQTWLRGIGTVLGSSCASVDSPEDRAVLETLYNATGGPDWTNKANWLSDRPTREWYGVTTDANGRVNGLLLWENQLTGQIPTDLGSLTNLTHLYLDGNQLSGEIPSELGRLMNLTVLHLAGNQLTGCVPAGLGDVADNDLSELGLSSCDPLADLINRYDDNKNGVIDRSEVIRAINDYLSGGGASITRADVIKLINLYLSG